MLLTNIQFRIPRDSEGLAEGLFELLSLCSAARVQSNDVEIFPGFARDAVPTTRFVFEDLGEPRVEFTGTGLQSLSLRSEGRAARDRLGASPVDIAEIVKALSGRVLWIDHTGWNTPATGADDSWDAFVKTLGAASLMYAYPTGEPWFFILPGTPTERANGMTGFPRDRVPRFELVELSKGDCAAMQIDIQTNLSSSQVTDLFPGSKSVSLPGLEGYFRSVFVRHPWKGLEIRLDIRFGPGNPRGEWETGAWLVRNGTRCASDMKRIPRALPAEPLK